MSNTSTVKWLMDKFVYFYPNQTSSGSRNSTFHFCWKSHEHCYLMKSQHRSRTFSWRLPTCVTCDGTWKQKIYVGLKCLTIGIRCTVRVSWTNVVNNVKVIYIVLGKDGESFNETTIFIDINVWDMRCVCLSTTYLHLNWWLEYE